MRKQFLLSTEYSAQGDSFLATYNNPTNYYQRKYIYNTPACSVFTTQHLHVSFMANESLLTFFFKLVGSSC